MTAESALTNLANWRQQADQYLVKGNYSKAANLYEQAIAEEPNVKSHYWQLGLTLLLQGEEAEAQTTWLLGMAEGESEEIELWTAGLVEVLQTEAARQEDQVNYSLAWVIRQHLREINPVDINNLLHLIELAIQLEIFTGDELSSWGIVELLDSEPLIALEIDLLFKVLSRLLDKAFWHPATLELTKMCLAHVQQPISFLGILLPASLTIAYAQKHPSLAARFLELYLQLEAENVEVLRHLSCFYQNAKDYSKGIDTAKLCYSLSQTLPDKIYGIYLVLRGLMSAGGYWQEACELSQEQESLLLSLLKEQSTLPNQTAVQRLFNCTYFRPYLKDDLKSNRAIQNQVAQLCQTNTLTYAKEPAERYSQRVVKSRTKPLKIGYLCHCFKSHSVGWLARWVFKHHNRERFQIYPYLINYTQLKDPLQEWYINQGHQVYKGGSNSLEIAEKIYTDEIDVLIELDSITLDTTCQIMSLKPAPVQVTWLGWDASGIPAVDYFIADPYVLPESAQDYYTEKLWRLPQTYIAVDGFEVAVPTLRRDHLDIP
ncbi:MAG: O-linked N-acetylglucosamine transferase, SPINDLY family protein, partial [Symploca sp. SIO2G7]|nr:O-linked N-acetylglucosamine transferase, SPINDLY family protein [Symploca sp. SIO2G7]